MDVRESWRMCRCWSHPRPAESGAGILLRNPDGMCGVIATTMSIHSANQEDIQALLECLEGILEKA